MRLIWSIWLPTLLAFAAAVRADAAPPNVVIILADDLGFSDLGCYGGEIDTPHIDRLAAGGLQFTQGYNTARCWPTRGALLTGYYAPAIHRDSSPGIQGGNVGHRRPAWAGLLPALLAPAGYRSYHSGKWHIDGDPRQQGFLRSLQIEGGQNDFFDPDGVTVDGEPIKGGDGFYVTTAVGDHAVECLRDHAASHAGAPFLSYVAFTSPHFPLHAPQEVVAKYKARYLAGWDTLRQARYRRLFARRIISASLSPLEPDVGPPYQPKPEVLAKFGPGEIDRPRPWASLSSEQHDFQATKMAIHAAMVEMMDRAVGKIVGQLEKMKAIDDTLILFLSDNGGSAEIMIRGKGHDPSLPPGSSGTYCCLGPGFSSCANTPFRRHKTWVHEGGIATPWIVHWPKGFSSRAALRTQPVHVIDVVPTVLELAGVAAPREHDGQPVPPLQGKSFAACLTDPSAPPPHETLWWCHEGHRAVRVGSWKLVATKNQPWELYDLAKDRTETTNLASAQPDRVAAMERAWTAINETCRQLAELDGREGQPSGRQSAAPKAAAATPVKGSLAGRRPNIIYVMTDDQGYGDVGSHGNPILKTPHLDRLRDESVRLTEYHVSPTCAPTRSALLTGRHEFRSGITHTILERERLALSATTLPQLLKSAGYTSGIFGKWHLGDEDEYQPGRRGFDRVFIHGAGGIGQSYPGSCGDVPGNTYMNPTIRSDGTFVQTAGYCTDVFFREAETWVEACHKKEQPFFCYIATNAPHGPYIPPPGGREQAYREALAAAGITNAKQLTDAASFFAMIENIDANMGRLLRKLEDLGIADDTLVVFSTDNGSAAGSGVFNDGMRDRKGSCYRGGTRVPAFWRWKGTLPEGIDVPAVTAHIDVLPTLCEITGATIPPAVAEKVEGRSLVPLLADPSASWPDRPLVTHVGRWNRGQATASAYRNCRLREGKWSLVNTKNRPDAWELYDIAADPGEQTDLAAMQPDVVRRMVSTYDMWWQSVQPDLVNEDLDGPAENPFKTAYREQYGLRPTPSGMPECEDTGLAEADVGFTKCVPRVAGRPNIVFFLCDDLGIGDLSCLGSNDIKTPNIDALFARGTQLSRHWAGNAVCAPSRCVLMTGKHPGHAAIRSNREVKPEGQPPMPAGTVTLVQLLKDAGYATGGFGKWGLGFPGSESDPSAVGFDAFFGYNCQREAHSFYPDHLWDGRSRVEIDNMSLAGGPVPRSGTVPAAEATRPESFAPYSGQNYSADLIAARQLAFIKANASRPFFLYVPTTVPHRALQVPADEPSLLEYEQHFGDEKPYLGGNGYVPCRHPLATYAAMITRMDREVGRIVQQLEDLGLTDDTIFIFSSDNGAASPGTGGLDTARLRSNGPLRDWKSSPYEGGLRVPTVAVWPGHIPAGKSIDTPTGFEDWLPTLLDLAGLHERIPSDIDGVSLAAALRGQPAAPQDRVLYRELTERQWQTVLDADGRWKAIRRAFDKKQPGRAARTELYDLVTDPGETRDVAADHPDVVKRLEATLAREHTPHPDWPLPFAAVGSRTKQAPAAAATKRPNILFIIVDDQSPFDLKCYNPASILDTPAIDRLAAEGMVFDAAYHMGSFVGAVCSPSRHMVMCGRSVWHLPISPARTFCPPDIVQHTLASVFNRAGYDTMRTCKRGNSYAAADAVFTIRHDADKKKGTHDGGSGWHGDRVMEYLTEREQRKDTEPFLIFFGFSHPHDTRDGTPELLAKYGATNHTDATSLPPADPRQPPLPANWLPGHPFDHGHMDVRDEVAVSGVWKNRDQRTIRNELGREFACSENIDRQIARVLDKLAAIGELDNTWIFYTADHGIAIGRHGLQGKQNLYEHTWRVPLIVKGPGVEPGSRAPGNIYLGDTLATICEICAIQPPASNEGKSFLPVLAGRQQTVRDVLYGVYCGGQKPGIRSVRQGDWKLIKYESPSGGLHTQLFNLRDNPQEFLAEHHDRSVAAALPAPPQPRQKNLATDPAHAERCAAMESLLLAEMQRHDDPHRFSDQRRPQRPQASQATVAVRPNIVLFLADDLGYGELGCYGNAAAITPNLDRFAAEGLRLTDCHSASSVCSPSRSSLLTGRTPYRNGVYTWIPEKSPIHLRTSEIALPKMLKQSGYQTCHVGKWHLNGMFNSSEQPQPSDHGYDWWLATQNNAAPSHAFPANFVRNGTAIGKVNDYSAPFIAQEAATWLKTKRDTTQPFFLAVWTHEPHYPIASAERYEKQHAHIADPEERTYRANVTQLDDAFGTLMKAIDEIGATDSTLVFFTSDNGPEGTGDKGPGRGLAGPLRGRKRSMYEGGHRVPGMVRWPGKIEPGSQSDLPVIGSDFFSTAVAAAGLEPPPGVKLDGTDISGLRIQEMRPMYWRWGGFVAYREGPWKIVTDEAFGKPELYNLADDLAETTDLAAREPERLAAMLERLRSYTAGVEAEAPDWWRTHDWNPKKRVKQPSPVPAG